MKNAINWFEIAVQDIDRAKKFYETILGHPCQEMGMNGERHVVFPCDMENGVGGSMRLGEDGFKPSTDGALIYLNADPDLSHALGRIEGAGGRIEVPKTSIGKNGYIAIFHDTEGNRMALHSQQ